MINAFFLLKERNITAFYHKCVIDTSLWKLQPKGKTKTLLIAIFFLLRRKITTITKSCSLVFFFLFWSILYIEPDHLFFLFASNSHFPVSEPLFTHPNSFPSIVPLHFYDHMLSQAQQFFLQLFPCPNPSISLPFLAYQFMSELFQITCLVFVSPKLTDFVIFVPPQPHTLRRAKFVVHYKVSNFPTALKLRLNLMTDTVCHVSQANHGRAFFSAVYGFRILEYLVFWGFDMKYVERDPRLLVENIKICSCVCFLKFVYIVVICA